MAVKCCRFWRQGAFPLALVLAWVLTLGVGDRPAQAVPEGGYAHPPLLIQAEELKALLDRKDPRVRVVDVRHKAKYYLGHIPGALQVWRPELEDRKAPFPGLPPPAAQLEKLLSGLGVTNRDTLIIYSDQYDHTRLWWVLAYYGFPLERLRLLDGGLEAWKTKGYPLQLTSPRVKRTSFQLPPVGARREFLLAGLEEVKAAMGHPGKVLVDDRPQKQFLGLEKEEGAARAGHIPGAVGVDWHETRVADGPFKGFFKSAAAIRELYAALWDPPEKDLYLYGHHHLSSSHTLFSLYLAGYPLEKLHLYAGSWLEWSRSKEPLETAPRRGGP
jgi:thiosulfate/3-mercaptopyruvate sulfurtransferase